MPKNGKIQMHFKTYLIDDKKNVIIFVENTSGGRKLYTLTGKIIHGKGNGRKVGMPTANLQYEKVQNLPKPGVYGVMAYIDGMGYEGVTNVGTRPSIDDDTTITVETYIPGMDLDLYGKTMKVEFYIFLREICKFDSLEAVKKQVEKDVCRTKEYFRNRSREE